jgi:Lyzozyme M1 (1,4-beta-N-acetylmuramidase)
MAQYKGIDVSHYQGNIDFQKIKSAGYKFVIIKATEGSYSVDPMFRENVRKANAADLQTHAYHYFLGTSEFIARAEADWCARVLKRAGVKGSIFLDVEDNMLPAAKGLLTNYVNLFLDQMDRNGHAELGIYASKYFFENRLITSRLRKGLLVWIARYNATLGRSADIWQHRSDASVPGITGPVDEDIAYTRKVLAPPKIKQAVTVSINTLLIPYRKRYQTYLNQLGYPLVVDGIKEPLTTAALKDFQRKQGIRADGVANTATYAALKKAVAHSNQVYTVVSGDSLWEIAQENKTTVAGLKNLNKLHSGTIYPGQKLRLK